MTTRTGQNGGSKGPRLADIVSLVGLGLGLAAVIEAVWGEIETALRLLFLAYAADVLDGWVARRYGTSNELGFMLDRSIDRVTQIIAPLVIYASWISGEPLAYRILFVVYASLLGIVAFYRLIYRRVTGLTHFAGLPMFFHAGILLTSVIAGIKVNPLVLYAGLIASAVPVPYFRRMKTSSNPSPATWGRLLVILVLALLPYDHWVIVDAAMIVHIMLVAYLALGWLVYRVSERLEG